MKRGRSFPANAAQLLEPSGTAVRRSSRNTRNGERTSSRTTLDGGAIVTKERRAKKIFHASIDIDGKCFPNARRSARNGSNKPSESLSVPLVSERPVRKRKPIEREIQGTNESDQASHRRTVDAKVVQRRKRAKVRQVQESSTPLAVGKNTTPHGRGKSVSAEFTRQSNTVKNATSAQRQLGQDRASIKNHKVLPGIDWGHDASNANAVSVLVKEGLVRTKSSRTCISEEENALVDFLSGKIQRAQERAIVVTCIDTLTKHTLQKAEIARLAELGIAANKAQSRWQLFFEQMRDKICVTGADYGDEEKAFLTDLLSGTYREPFQSRDKDKVFGPFGNRTFWSALTYDYNVRFPTRMRCQLQLRIKAKRSCGHRPPPTVLYNKPAHQNDKVARAVVLKASRKKDVNYQPPGIQNFRVNMQLNDNAHARQQNQKQHHVVRPNSSTPAPFLAEKHKQHKISQAKVDEKPKKHLSPEISMATLLLPLPAGPIQREKAKRASDTDWQEYNALVALVELHKACDSSFCNSSEGGKEQMVVGNDGGETLSLVDDDLSFNNKQNGTFISQQDEAVDMIGSDEIAEDEKKGGGNMDYRDEGDQEAMEEEEEEEVEAEEEEEEEEEIELNLDQFDTIV